MYHANVNFLDNWGRQPVVSVTHPTSEPKFGSQRPLPNVRRSFFLPTYARAFERSIARAIERVTGRSRDRGIELSNDRAIEL